MKIFFILLFLASVFAALHPVNKQIVNEIKGKADTWTPIEPEENPFAYMSIEQIKGMMGYKKRINIITSQAKHAPVPDTFDSRNHWKGSAQKIRDQQQCGSCWAFGATGALSDRFYIASNGKVDVELSPQYLVSCDQSNFGCNGGYLDEAWFFFKITGVPTDDCVPYTSGGGDRGACPTECKNGTDLKFYQVNEVKVCNDIEYLQNAIFNEGGPVEVGFTVYEDFMNYKSGIYQHKTGSKLGGHAVKALGWGEENGIKYWIMANSWNTKWGEQGFFKIAFGECGIESDVVYGTPQLSSFSSE